MKAVLYAAKSTQDHRGSIPDQLKDGRAIAEQRDWDIAGEFQDEAKSAYHGSRGDGLTDAMALCEQIAPCALIVQHSDRLARGDAKQARHLIEIVLWGIKSGVELVSKQDPEVLSGGDYGLLMGAIGGMRNHQDSKRKAQAVRDGARRRAAKGLPTGGPRPFGYEWVGPKYEKRLVTVPVEAEIVRQMFEKTIDKVSQRGLARWLLAEGVKTSTGKTFGQSSIQKILANPLYAGKVRFTETGENGEKIVRLFDGEHEKVIDLDLFERVQVALADKVRRTGGRSPNSTHLLTKGILRCGRCQRALIPRVERDRRGNPTRDLYICSGRLDLGPEFCEQTPLDREAVDEALLTDLLDRYVDIDRSRQRIRERMSADLRIAGESVDHAERDVADCDSRLNRVERGWQREVLSDDEYVRQRDEITAEKNAALSAFERAQDRLAEVEQGPGLDQDETAVVEQLERLRASVARGVGKAPDLSALRLTIASLFDQVVYLHDGHLWLESAAAMRESGSAITGGVLVPFLRDSAIIESGDPVAVILRKIDLPSVSKSDHDGLTR